MVLCAGGFAEEQRLLESGLYVGLGTIIAEVVNLRPLFLGKKEANQLFLITQVLGDPCETYGFDERGKLLGGRRWDGAMQMARDNFGFTFQKVGWYLFPRATALL